MTEQDYPIVVTTDDFDPDSRIQAGDNIGSLTIRVGGTTYESDIIVDESGSYVFANAEYNFGVIQLSGLHERDKIMSIYRLTGDFGDCTVESITLNW